VTPSGIFKYMAKDKQMSATITKPIILAGKSASYTFFLKINYSRVMTYLGTNLTNQNSIAEEIKSRLKSGNARYHSVQNLLSSRLLSKNLKIKIYRTIILPVFFVWV